MVMKGGEVRRMLRRVVSMGSAMLVAIARSTSVDIVFIVLCCSVLFSGMEEDFGADEASEGINLWNLLLLGHRDTIRAGI